MSKFPDNFDLSTAVMRMWINCIVPEDDQEEIVIPTKLEEDIKLLRQQLDGSDFLHYVKSLK